VTDVIGTEIRSHAERRIDPGAVLALYATEGWWPERTSTQLATVLDSGPAVGAYAGDRLVGFARAVTDGAFRTYVEDVIVAPDARGAGIGRSLTALLLQLVPATAVTSLFCAEPLTALYSASGFRPTAQIVMHHRPSS
jgi:ribosomal protein S18 acetylase RimI-like enzyme